MVLETLETIQLNILFYLRIGIVPTGQLSVQLMLLLEY